MINNGNKAMLPFKPPIYIVVAGNIGAGKTTLAEKIADYFQFNAFYEALTARGLARKPVLIGLSRGGLYAYRWAAENPDNGLDSRTKHLVEKSRRLLQRFLLFKLEIPSTKQIRITKEGNSKRPGLSTPKISCAFGLFPIQPRL